MLDRVPFVTGYGVEIAMLVDLLDLAGLDAPAQVDLGERTHRNQSNEALGQMVSISPPGLPTSAVSTWCWPARSDHTRSQADLTAAGGAAAANPEVRYWQDEFR